jgi:hypothetical protein
MDMLRRLKDIGFKKSGLWKKDGDGIGFDPPPEAKEALYAFVVGGAVKYVGKTTGGLARRLTGYRKPGPSQSTNQRVHKEIRAALDKNNVVEIYAFCPDVPQQYGSFQINLPAGLEDSIIAALPAEKWNML